MPVVVGTVIQFIGGTIVRVAATALVIGIFFVLAGVTPWQFAVKLITEPPSWINSAYFRLGILLLGFAIIWFSLTFNRWSTKQKTIDSLAEDISWAIDNLLNRLPPEKIDDPDSKFVDDWKKDFESWCHRVSRKLDNRAFFTRADQLHFDYLGFIDPIVFYQNPRLNNLLSQLRLKIERLRDVINWTQQRRR
jgi:hypothetical protein